MANPNGQKYKNVAHGDAIQGDCEDQEWTIEEGKIIRRWPVIVTDPISAHELPQLIADTESKITFLQARLATLQDYAAKATALAALPESDRIIKVKAEKAKK